MRHALFLHTQKTAGTSIQDIARDVYGDHNVASHDDYVTLGIEGCAKLPFVSGHFGMEFARPLMKGRYCFTFLRNPITRLVSLYSFCSTRQSDDFPIYAAARRTSFKGFLQLAVDGNTDVRHAVWNHQVWQLAFGHGAALADVDQASMDDFGTDELLAMAKRNLRLFDYVGFVETADEDIVKIFNQLGRPNATAVRSNVTATGLKLDSLSSDVIVLAGSLTYLDQLLYDYAWLQRGAGDANSP